MAKLKLNLDPTFRADVQITVPGVDEPGTLQLTFKYRGRKEYAEFLESMQDKKGKKEKSVAEAFPLFVTGWDLDEEFTPENIETFLNNYPAAYMEIVGQYAKLLMGSRIKN